MGISQDSADGLVRGDGLSHRGYRLDLAGEDIYSYSPPVLCLFKHLDQRASRRVVSLARDRQRWRCVILEEMKSSQLAIYPS